jgi:hypothetical protein
MKENDAPEKIYLVRTTRIIDEWRKKPSRYGHNIEYTHTDYFIEKACDFIKSNIDHYIGHYLNDDDAYLDDSFIVDFKKYMKGD